MNMNINTVSATGNTALTGLNGSATKAENAYGIFKDENGNSVYGDKNEQDISDAKIITENFKNEIMSKLDTSKSKRPSKTIKYYLGKLINVTQTLNGVQKNNLKPNGTPEQNDIYNKRLREMISLMNDYAGFVESGLSVVQDSKTGLYKLCINDKLYDIPERKVEIVPVAIEGGQELMPEIVD